MDFNIHICVCECHSYTYCSSLNGCMWLVDVDACSICYVSRKRIQKKNCGWEKKNCEMKTDFPRRVTRFELVNIYAMVWVRLCLCVHTSESEQWACVSQILITIIIIIQNVHSIWNEILACHTHSHTHARREIRFCWPVSACRVLSFRQQHPSTK